jgi:replicative DNA helicase
MASVGLQLLSHIIRTGCLTEVLNWGITADDLPAAHEKQMFDMLLAYKAEYGAVFGPALLKQKFPMFDLCDDGAQVTFQALCGEVRVARLRLDAAEIGEELTKLAKIDPMQALTLTQAKIQQAMNLGSKARTDLHIADVLDDVYIEYELIESGKYQPRLLTPWAALNEQIMGIQEDDFIVLYGRPKSKKTWVLSKMMAYAYDMGAPLLIYTKEMTPKNLVKRMVAAMCELPYFEFRIGRLTNMQKEILAYTKNQAHLIMKQRNTIILSAKDVAAGGDTPSWLRAKIEKYKPAACFVDGLYLMSPEGGRKNMADNERVQNISRHVRQVIMDTKTPVIATMQANRKAAQHDRAELDEVAFSDSISQDATMLARVINEKQPQVYEGVETETIAVVLGGAREFKMHGFRIGGEPAVDFRFKEVLTERDIRKAKTNDANEDEPEVAGEHARTRKKLPNGGDVTKDVAAALKNLGA